jgi:hypothetical protein
MVTSPNICAFAFMTFFSNSREVLAGRQKHLEGACGRSVAEGFEVRLRSVMT